MSLIPVASKDPMDLPGLTNIVRHLAVQVCFLLAVLLTVSSRCCIYTLRFRLTLCILYSTQLVTFSMTATSNANDVRANQKG